LNPEKSGTTRKLTFSLILAKKNCSRIVSTSDINKIKT
jgi:hypothetical protein